MGAEVGGGAGQSRLGAPAGGQAASAHVTPPARAQRQQAQPDHRPSTLQGTEGSSLHTGFGVL